MPSFRRNAISHWSIDGKETRDSQSSVMTASSIGDSRDKRVVVHLTRTSDDRGVKLRSWVAMLVSNGASIPLERVKKDTARDAMEHRRLAAS